MDNESINSVACDSCAPMDTKKHSKQGETARFGNFTVETGVGASSTGGDFENQQSLLLHSSCKPIYDQMISEIESKVIPKISEVLNESTIGGLRKFCVDFTCTDMLRKLNKEIRKLSDETEKQDLIKSHLTEWVKEKVNGGTFLAALSNKETQLSQKEFAPPSKEFIERCLSLRNTFHREARLHLQRQNSSKLTDGVLETTTGHIDTKIQQYPVGAERGVNLPYAESGPLYLVVSQGQKIHKLHSVQIDDLRQLLKIKNPENYLLDLYSKQTDDDKPKFISDLQDMVVRGCYQETLIDSSKLYIQLPGANAQPQHLTPFTAPSLEGRANAAVIALNKRLQDINSTADPNSPPYQTDMNISFSDTSSGTPYFSIFLHGGYSYKLSSRYACDSEVNSEYSHSLHLKAKHSANYDVTITPTALTTLALGAGFSMEYMIENKLITLPNIQDSKEAEDFKKALKIIMFDSTTALTAFDQHRYLSLLLGLDSYQSDQLTIDPFIKLDTFGEINKDVRKTKNTLIYRAFYRKDWKFGKGRVRMLGTDHTEHTLHKPDDILVSYMGADGLDSLKGWNDQTVTYESDFTRGEGFTAHWPQKS